MGRSYRLTWRNKFAFEGYIGNWISFVDAHSGEVLALYDDNKYACSFGGTQAQGRIQGGVRPARATDPEELKYFPTTLLVDDGVDKVTDFNGYYLYSGLTAAVDTRRTVFRDGLWRSKHLSQPNASGLQRHDGLHRLWFRLQPHQHPGRQDGV